MTHSGAAIYRIWSAVLVLVGALVLTGNVLADPSDTNPTGQSDFVDNPYGIPVTRWVDPLGSKPTTFAEWKAAQEPVRDMTTVEVTSRCTATAGAKATTEMCIFVNADIYDSLTAQLDVYIADLLSEDYAVTVITVDGGTGEELRSLIQDQYALGMDGCLFIGDLPIVWYETDCWDPLEHEMFPTDLFYMDVDGVFIDSDSDGMYDDHTGDLAPEIWLGRLTASPLTMDGATELGLLKNYFRKDHLYRTGQLPVTNRALVYIDDDWSSDASATNGDVGYSYTTRNLYYDKDTTWGPHYMARLPEGYDFIHVMVHSSPQYHSFKNTAGQWSSVANSDVKAADPVGHFYNLFACSNSRYIEYNYMGGWYIFCDTWGLASIGTTKTGSMLEFDDFYEPFGRGRSIGEAFCEWFATQANGGFADWETCWYYGMTLCGDPTLKRLPTVTADNAFGPSPLNVTFEADLGLPITTCHWQFGDGDTSSVEDPVHEYTTPGCYDVGLDMNSSTGSFTLHVPRLVSAYADTVAIADVYGAPGGRVGVEVELRNYLPLKEIKVPFTWVGPLDLVFDSISTSGLRTDYFEYVTLSNMDPFNRRATISLNCSNTGSQPYLNPGNGAVIRIWFTVPGGATPDTNQIALTDYSTNHLSLLTYAGEYEPVGVDGSVTYPTTCCTGPSVGNIDGSIDQLVTMADLTVMIDHLFITLAPLDCVDEGNLDMSPDNLVTMSDLTILIDHLFITLASLPACP